MLVSLPMFFAFLRISVLLLASTTLAFGGSSILALCVEMSGHMHVEIASDACHASECGSEEDALEACLDFTFTGLDVEVIIDSGRVAPNQPLMFVFLPESPKYSAKVDAVRSIDKFGEIPKLTSDHEYSAGRAQLEFSNTQRFLI